MPPPRDPLDREEVARLYRQGLPITKVAERVDYSWKAVKQALVEEGVELRRPHSKTGRWAGKLYSRWKLMRSKCNRPGDPSYARIGARGIRVCAEWEDFNAFKAWALRSGYAPELDLARRDEDRDFSPSNCCWRTRAETNRLSHLERSPAIRAFGVTKSLAEWAEDVRCVVSMSLLRRRLQLGHRPELAMTARSLKGVPATLRENPVLRPTPRRRKSIDPARWKRAEREWLAGETSIAALAKRFGVARTVIERRVARLGPPPGQDAPLAGAERTALQKVWHGLHRRAYDPGEPGYRWVGARGIGICAEWHEFDRFMAWAASTGYRPGLWLMRTNVGRDFSPANCHWLTPSEARRRPRPGGQAWPTLKTPVPAFGEVRSASAWGEDPRCQVSGPTVIRRLRAGWEPEAAIATPGGNGGRPARLLIEAFGERKSLYEWGRDPRCRVSAHGLGRRISRGIPAEEAISTPPFELVPRETRSRGSR